VLHTPLHGHHEERLADLRGHPRDHGPVYMHGILDIAPAYDHEPFLPWQTSLNDNGLIADLGDDVRGHDLQVALERGQLIPPCALPLQHASNYDQHGGFKIAQVGLGASQPGDVLHVVHEDREQHEPESEG